MTKEELRKILIGLEYCKWQHESSNGEILEEFTSEELDNLIALVKRLAEE